MGERNLILKKNEKVSRVEWELKIKRTAYAFVYFNEKGLIIVFVNIFRNEILQFHFVF